MITIKLKPGAVMTNLEISGDVTFELPDDGMFCLENVIIDGETNLVALIQERTSFAVDLTEEEEGVTILNASESLPPEEKPS